MGVPMRIRTLRSRSFWWGCAAVVAALLLVGAWGVTFHRNAWARASPRYVSVHRGNVALLSTLWRKGERGGLAWTSRGWMYDVLVPRRSVRWRPSSADIGTVYAGTPAYRAPLSALFVPLWTLALAPAALALVWFRRARWWRAEGCCSRCGYDLKGLDGRGAAPEALCPECGTPIGPAAGSTGGWG